MTDQEKYHKYIDELIQLEDEMFESKFIKSPTMSDRKLGPTIDRMELLRGVLTAHNDPERVPDWKKLNQE